MLSSLPQSNNEESLETISKNKLLALFDTQYFEVRPEVQRDKGVDLIIEIKKDDCYTNFRFAVQLKSTRKLPAKKDESVTYKVDLSNINYLSNFGMPAYYILYDHAKDKFYITRVTDVYNSILKRYASKKLPKQFSVKFNEELTTDIMEAIYQDTFETGKLLRNLNAHLNISFDKSEYNSGVLIDEINEVYSVEQNIQFINQYGFQLLNDSAFERIVEIEQRTHPRKKASAMFNLICGIAYHQRYNLFKAIELLKLADTESAKFDIQTQSLLQHSLLHVKYLLGMIDEPTFNLKVGEVMDNDNLSSFLQLKKILKEFILNTGDDKSRLDVLYKEIHEILLKESDNINARIMAYAFILKAEAKILVNDLSHNLVLICGKIANPQQTKTFRNWIKLERQYSSRMNSLVEFAHNQQDYLATSNLTMDGIKWVYTKTFLTHIFQYWNKSTFTVDGELSNDDRENIIRHAERIENVIKSYEILGHKENLVMSLFNKYELQHFAGDADCASITANKIQELIEDNEFNGLRNDFSLLLNGGTAYEKFLLSFQEHMRNLYEIVKSTDLVDFYNQDISEEVLSFIEEDIKWTITDFYEFDFS